ncbi:MFS transporter [Thermoleptolyngbya sp. C42_A2020_037]|uniref:MFS transporter n=1 Tax=Thermoleptolyngbya sp. C42_A2020_037 TaxID=2747799 RepID=UPI001A07E2C3|nr:MFS transporter [Thermoleptolyngbya sp. C42_A2020_037]MBF2086301.1 MFS transporter [Thermoleptolyngbya sp. C42_A2020_037]
MQRIDPDLVPLRMITSDEEGDRPQPPTPAERHSSDRYRGQVGQWESPTPDDPSPLQNAAKNGKLPENGKSSQNGKAADTPDLAVPEPSAASLLETSPKPSGHQTDEPTNPGAANIHAGKSTGDDPQDSDTPESERGFLPVLRNRNFLALWSGQVFSQLADKVYLVLMIMLITSRFQSAGQTVSGWVSSVMVAFTIPAVLFGSVAGVFVDHWSKKAVLVATNLLRGGLVLVLPPLLWISQGWSPLAGIPVGFLVLLSVTFLVSTLTQFFAPAEQAAIPMLVERKHLLSANSLYTTTMMASVIVGFAVGEPLLALADGAIAHVASQFGLTLNIGKELIVGLSYALAGLLLLLIQPHETIDQSKDDLPPVWENIRDGLRYLKQQRRVRAALIQLIVLFSIFAALAVLAVRLAEVMPAIKSSQFGFLLAAGGVGMALGAVTLGHSGTRLRRHRLSLYGALGMGAALAALSFFTQQLVPTLLLLVLFGACAAIVAIPLQTVIQEETPEEMRGKVFGLQNNAVNIALSLPLALAGVAETLLGLRVVFLGLAAVAIAAGVFTQSISTSDPATVSQTIK